MKLIPPASSSDLEVAREIARRLNQHRRRDDRHRASEAPGPVEPAAFAPPKRLSPPPLPPRGAGRAEVDLGPAVRMEESVVGPEPASPPEPPRREPPRDEPPRSDPPTKEPPLQKEPPPRPEPPRREPPTRAAATERRLEFEQSFGVSEPEVEVPVVDTWNPSELSPEDEGADEAAIEGDLEMKVPEDEEPLEALADASPFAASSADVVLEDDGLSPEQLVGADPEASPLDELAGSEVSPFDDAVLDEAQAGEPDGLSWDDVVDGCLALAQATAAMLIDPAGQVFAARGDWPAPGPDAIATKLVSMMEKTLKDAPTRSISAPLMGLHLTAWRVPLHEGLVTVAFLARSPVRADARPAIDTEIHRGTGA
jgi:hypothetical protein